MMTQFELDERHEQHRETVREFCETAVEPRKEEHEERGEFPHEILRDVGEAGLHGVPFPTEYGGAGLDWRSLAITLEELARSWHQVSGVVSVSCCLAGQAIERAGSEWQRDEWLRDICTGRRVVAASITEPDAGSDAASLATRAERDGDEYVIDGHKVWTTNGAESDLLVVLARTGEAGHGGLSLIGIPDPQDTAGVEFVRNIPSMEDGAVESEVRYENVRVPVENRIGEEGDGFKHIMSGLDMGRIGTAAQAVGVAQAAFDASRSFADEREQFGRPIRDFQGVSFKLADMKMGIAASRLLTLYAAGLRDRGERVTQEAAIAKTFATDTVMDVTTEAVQIHGSRGYSQDYPLEGYMRTAKGMQIYEGTNEINRLVISNHLYD